MQAGCLSPDGWPQSEFELLLCVQKVQVHPCISREGLGKTPLLEQMFRALQPVSADSRGTDGPTSRPDTKQLSGILGVILPATPWKT